MTKRANCEKAIASRDKEEQLLLSGVSIFDSGSSYDLLDARQGVLHVTSWNLMVEDDPDPADEAIQVIIVQILSLSYLRVSLGRLIWDTHAHLVCLVGLYVKCYF